VFIYFNGTEQDFLTTHSKSKQMITFTETAKTKLQSIYEEDEMVGIVFLRLGIAGGGCAGFTHKMFFDTIEPPSEFDETGIVNENITWMCDPLSMQYLDGTTIDHVATLMQEGFKFINEKIKATCGCGNSSAY